MRQRPFPCGVLESIFAGYVRLVSQNLYSTLIYFVISYGRGG